MLDAKLDAQSENAVTRLLLAGWGMSRLAVSQPGSRHCQRKQIFVQQPEFPRSGAKASVKTMCYSRGTLRVVSQLYAVSNTLKGSTPRKFKRQLVVSFTSCFNASF